MDRLVKDDIDICLIQETKLKEGQELEDMEGYNQLRADRIQDIDGGGLLTIAKTSLNLSPLDKIAKEGTETQSSRVRLGKNNWVYLTNVYIPPSNSTGQDIVARTDIIPTFPSSLICGELNGHSILWDDNQPPNKRGEDLENWIIDKGLAIMNTGEETHINKATGNGSAPDITLVGSNWKGKAE